MYICIYVYNSINDLVKMFWKCKILREVKLWHESVKVYEIYKNLKFNMSEYVYMGVYNYINVSTYTYNDWIKIVRMCKIIWNIQNF